MLISLLITLIMLGLIYYEVTLLPLPAPFKTGALVVVCLLAIIYLLRFLPGRLGV